MSAESVGIIPFVVAQHVEDADFLHSVRTALASASHVKFKDFVRFDNRLAAQIDALTIAGSAGGPFCKAALESPSPGAAFTLTVRAIQDQQPDSLMRLLALAEASPSIRRGLTSGLGWVDPSLLQGTVLALLRDEQPFRRTVGLTACGMHRFDCGLANGPWIRDNDGQVRARALRTCGEIGLDRLVPDLTYALGGDDAECRFWASWSSVLLGHSGAAVGVLASTASTPGPHSERAFTLVLQAMEGNDAHNFVRDLVADASRLYAIRGSGIIGDPAYVPWLINEMSKPATARRAAKSFSLITAVDLAVSGLHTNRPEDFESGPTDNPEDVDVVPDADDGLPWPNPEKVQQWWAVNGSRFQKGTRYFMGQPVTREHCIGVLKSGYQRQQILAAHYLCLLEPGAPLFNISAPAWRQQRLLAAM